ncbi:MAG: gamma carbonic anhydrase family protein [Gammaproteobacteria bacterium]|nr:gamma carbonic anhydrase family protein [Gammaproteobacteria bacterium]
MTIRTFQNHTPNIHKSSYIDQSALVIGQVEIGADSSIWPMSVVRGDINTITIGERTNIQDGSILHVSHDGEFSPGGASMTIGSDVTVGHSVVLHACTLMDCCLIGIGSVILDKAIVHKHAMVGAGSLVTNGKELDGGYLWMGRPAKKVRKLREREIEYLSYSANHYVKVKRMHESS